METVFLIIALVLSIIGFIGCIVPGLPGPPLNYIALLIVQFYLHSFQTYTLILYGIATAIILVLDYMLPIWFAKKYGATKEGIWGSIIGMLLGMIFTPIGMILGMLLGAIIGDMIAGRNSPDAVKSGFATFFGTLFSIGLKLGLSGIMTALVIYELVRFYF